MAQPESEELIASAIATRVSARGIKDCTGVTEMAGNETNLRIMVDGLGYQCLETPSCIIPSRNFQGVTSGIGIVPTGGKNLSFINTDIAYNHPSFGLILSGTNLTFLYNIEVCNGTCRRG